MAPKTGTAASPPSPSLADVITPLAATTSRRLPLIVHERLREMILHRQLPPESTLKQAEVARLLGVSRTPIREAFRMLQEEGLIVTEPDQRAVVIGFDVVDLDETYASRILLESLAAGMTASTIGEAMLAELDDALERMHRFHREHRTSTDWAGAHRDFHVAATSGASPHLRKEVQRLTERTHHYVRLAQFGNADNWSSAEGAHRAVLTAMQRHEKVEAGRAMAHHLASTARHIVAQIDPSVELPAIAMVLELVGAPAADGAPKVRALAQRPAPRRRRTSAGSGV